ncbi:hypothetical protein BH10PSE11_BH10PSE11_31280 [soil metagenome]
MLAAILDVLAYILGAALCLFLLFGFWRGLTLPPHKEGHRTRESIAWWYGQRE